MSVSLALLGVMLMAPHMSVPDHDLAGMRGGFALPGGLDVALAVQTDTSVDGALVLRTVFSADRGPPSLQVQTAGATGLVTVPVPSGGGAATPGQVSIHEVGRATRVELASNGLDVSHLVGGTFGSAIANTVSNRTIDTVTSVMIDMRGTMPMLMGSAALRIGAVAQNAIAGR